jgi:hypothetical protein
MNFNWNQIPPMPQEEERTWMPVLSNANPNFWGSVVNRATPQMPQQRQTFSPHPLPGQPPAMPNGRQALPDFLPMPGPMPQRQPWQMPEMPKPRDRRIKKGSTLQSLGWLLAALAAPKAVEGYLAGRNEGFDRADESDMREYQMLLQQGQYGANQQQEADRNQQADLWKRYEAGVDQRKLVGSENDDASDAATALQRLTDARFKTNLGAGMDFFKSRGLPPSIEFMQWASNPDLYPYPTLTDAPLLGSPMNKGATTVLDTIANTTGNPQVGNELVNQGLPANAPRSEGDPYQLGGSVKHKAEQTQAVIRKPEEDEKERQFKLQMQTQKEIAQAQRDMARYQAQAAAAAERAANRGNGGGSGGGGGGGGKSGSTSGKPQTPAQREKALNETRARNARMSPSQWKQWSAIGGASGPQARESLQYWIDRGVLSDTGGINFSATATPEQIAEFKKDQTYWKNGRWKYGGPGKRIDTWNNGKREGPNAGKDEPIKRGTPEGNKAAIGKMMNELANRKPLGTVPAAMLNNVTRAAKAGRATWPEIKHSDALKGYTLQQLEALHQAYIKAGGK